MDRESYPSDLTDVQWDIVSKLIPDQKPGGRNREVNIREVVNAVCYINRAGCSWRMLPRDFPAWETIYTYFRNWKNDGTWILIHDQLREDVRVASGRKPEPTAGVIDSQSVKTTEKGGVSGYDAGKKVKGRKRHIMVDVIGLLLVVFVHAADIQDRDGAIRLFALAKKKYSKLSLVWADGAYIGRLQLLVKRLYGIVVTIIKRSDNTAGFKVLPRRWVVERTFGWLGRYRRHSKDYEYLTASSEAMIYISMIQLMIRRLEGLQVSG